MRKSPLKQRVRPETLHALAEAGYLPPAAWSRALELTFATPDAGAWHRFLDRLLLFLGAALAAAGVIFFFAYNWQDLGRFAKFGLIEIGVLGAALTAWRLGMEKVSGQIALTVAAVLVIALMAVYGQVYQTGADDHLVFLVATVVLAPWVLFSRFPPLYMLYCTLLNTTFILSWSQNLGFRDPWQLPLACLLLCLLNGTCWFSWEAYRRRGVAWLEALYAPRLMALATFCALVVPLVRVLAKSRTYEMHALENLAFFVWPALSAFVLWFYRRIEPQLFMLTVALAAAVIVVTTAAVRYFFIVGNGEAGHVFLLAVLVLGQITGVTAWLRKTVTETEAP